MLFALTAAAQAPAEAEAYKNVGEARSVAERIGTGSARRAFRQAAEAFLAEFPDSGRRPTVNLWIGDVLKDDDPRKALDFYRRSSLPEARTRAADLTFRFDPPPPLEVERWIGSEDDPLRSSGKVTLLFFYSATYPSANPLTGRIEKLLNDLGPAGLRVVGVASVLDDPREQALTHIVPLIRGRRLPFPVGIDRQRESGRSVSLALYRGKSVPWGVFLDRYGRIVWVGPLPVEKNAFQRCNVKLQALLSEPSLEVLEERVHAGDEAALRKLASIKTVGSVTTLFRLRGAKPPAQLRSPIEEALRAVLPDGFSPAQGDEWNKVKNDYRYSFEKDRLVPR